jgi:hypothetical protein
LLLGIAAAAILALDIQAKRAAFSINAVVCFLIIITVLLGLLEVDHRGQAGRVARAVQLLLERLFRGPPKS